MGFLDKILEIGKDNTLVGILMLVVAIMPFYLIASFINKKKQQTGKDKEYVRGLIRAVLPGLDSYTTMFVGFHRTEGTIGRNTTYYYYYAIAFRQGECIVMPIRKGDNKSEKFKIDQMFKLTKENVGQVEFTVLATEFLDKNGERIFAYTTRETVSTIDKKECPFNIDQKEEYEHYMSFIEEFAAGINKN